MENKLKQVSFWTGMVIVVGSHLYMLFAGLPADQLVVHSIINLFAGGLFVYHKFG